MEREDTQEDEGDTEEIEEEIEEGHMGTVEVQWISIAHGHYVLFECLCLRYVLLLLISVQNNVLIMSFLV